MSFAQIAGRCRNMILGRFLLKLCVLVIIPVMVLGPLLYPRAQVWQQVTAALAPAVEWTRLAAIRVLRGSSEPVRAANALDLVQAVGGFPATEIRCLALAIYYEAGLASTEAKAGIAQVVLNRATAAKLPRQLCKTIYGGLSAPGGCLFETACRNLGVVPRRTAELDQAVSTAVQIATGKLAATADVAKATHFHEKRAAPAWSRQMFKVATHGNLLFYSPEQPETAADPPTSVLPATSAQDRASRQSGAIAKRATPREASAGASAPASGGGEGRGLSRQVFGID